MTPRMHPLARLLVLVALFAALVWPRRADAHAMNPSLLQLDETAPGRVRVVWKVNVPESSPDDLTPELPDCVDASPRVSAHVGVGIVSSWSARCGARLAGTTVGVRGLLSIREEALVRVTLSDGRHFSTVLRAREPRFTIPATPGVWAVGRSYVALGIEHISTGLDHLAFVLGLVLLVGAGWPLLRAVTAFTVAHSITLALATLGIVHFPGALVEALIALSILFLALELARPPARRGAWTANRPWAIAFAFGLLHGFGFAGALADLGLPAGEIPIALVAFNAGVEAGQVAFVGAALGLLGIVRLAQSHISEAPRWTAERAGAWLIGTAAAYWTLDRVAAFWS